MDETSRDRQGQHGRGAREGSGSFLKDFIRENKWLVAFVIIFFTLMLLPLIFRGDY